MTKPPAASEKKGGRKKASTAVPGLEANFVQIVSEHLAGDPQREDVIWTCLTPTEIAKRLEQRGTPACPDTVRSMLDDFGFSRRQPEKVKTMGETPLRNEQFENIARLKDGYRDSPNPIISMDTKKKELLGEFWRTGEAYGNGPNRVFDHDFPSYANGKLIPHGPYDLKRNAGHITLGLSPDTSEFACDSLRHWWEHHGRQAWPQARDRQESQDAWQKTSSLFLSNQQPFTSRRT